jgi:hypothetical protein
MRSIPEELFLHRQGSLAVPYIPFDWVNPGARVVIVGITPGFTQWKNAMAEAQRQLSAGVSVDTVLQRAKDTGAFSGAMRQNLIALLDYFEIQTWLGIRSCSALFSEAADLVQTTSALRHPVFVDGENYNGTPSMTGHPLLQRMLLECFAEETKGLRNAIYVPLGPKVSEAMDWLVARGYLDAKQVLSGLPHPSVANAERIQYMLERKPRANLSLKTDPIKLDRAREELRAKIRQLN